MKEKALSILKLKKIWIPAVLVIGFGLYTAFGPQKTASYVTAEVTRGNLEQIVTVTGTVESQDRVELRFEQSGTIHSIPVKVGDTVKAGSVLTRLNAEQLQARVAQSAAGVNMAQAELNLLLAGPSDPQVTVSQVKIEEAEINQKNAETKLEDLKSIQAEALTKANLEVANAQSKLDTALSEDDSSTDQSQSDLDSAYQDADPALLIAFSAVREALTSADLLYGLQGEPYSDDIEAMVKNANLTDQVDARNGFKRAEKALTSLEADYQSLQTTWNEEEEDALLTAALEMLSNAKIMIDKSYDILDDMNTSSEPLQVEIDTLIAEISAHQTPLNTSVSQIQTVQQAIANAKLSNDSSDLSSDSSITQASNNLAIAQSDLASLKLNQKIDLNEAEANLEVLKVRLKAAQADHADLIADPREVDLASARARIAQAKAELMEQQARLKQATLISPISGKVAEIAFEVGESANSTEIAVILLTDALQIKANISEVDISKIHSGDQASFNLDAFPIDQSWKAVVTSINPAETVIQGVIYYETTLVIEKSDQNPSDAEIRSGMTANIEILTDSREDVLLLPLQALQTEDDQNVVYLLKGGQKVSMPVALGLEGEENVEILEGLKEGDEVILYEENQ
jgi:multidrug efflux pump subunit AcrA (membrane-fusion protein)